MLTKRMLSFAAVAVALIIVAPALDAQVSGPPSKPGPEGIPATDIAFDPSAAGHPVCPPFGACPPAMQVTTEYLGFGVDFSAFSGNPPVGVFSDPPDKFGGVNGAGDLDLVTPTCGRIVEVGGTTQGLTDFIAASGGFVGGPADLLLEAFDIGGGLIGSSIADDGVDADGNLIAEVPDPTNSIASFCMTTPTADSFGMQFVYLNNPSMVPVELLSFDVE